VALREHHSEAFKAVALAVLESNGGNVKRTLRHLAQSNIHVARSTLRDWARADPENVAPEELRRIALEQLASAVELGVAKYAVLITDDAFIAHLAARSPQTVAQNFGILFDKLQLLRGKPTSIVAGQAWRKLLEDIRGAVAPAGAGDAPMQDDAAAAAAGDAQMHEPAYDGDAAAAASVDSWDLDTQDEREAA
jgi:hypothetical protein